MKQTELVLQYLHRNTTITPLEALRELGVFRLAAVVFELREQGHNIIARLVPVHTAHGKTAHVAEYRLGQGTGDLFRGRAF